MSDDSRLTALETALAHAEAALQDLSDLVRDQGDDIARLKAENRRLKSLIEDLRAGRDDADTAFVP